MKRGFVVVAASGIVVSILYLLPQFGFLFECEVTELAIHPSPDGQSIASIFRRDCGATTGLVTGVSMRSGGWHLVPRRSDEVIVIDGEERVDTKWQSDQELEIIIPSAASVFSRKHSWNDIKIVFSKTSAIPGQ